MPLQTKLLLFLACVVLATSLVVVSAEDYIEQGNCGDQLTWKLNFNTSTLTIEGEGDMYNYSQYSSKAAPWASKNRSSYVRFVEMKDGPTSIGENAFYNLIYLETAVIASTVSVIRNGAFYICSKLSSVTIPEGVTSMDYYAFRSCRNLTSVTLPSTLTSLGRSAFSDCYELTTLTIKSSNLSILHSAFSGCNKLTTVTFVPNDAPSEGVTIFEDYVFSGCSSLTSITLPTTLTSIGANAFSSCSSLDSVSLPEGVTTIGASAFASCSGMTSIIIPSTVTSIGLGAFSYCSGLLSVELPNITSLEISLFSGCSSLKSITIPSTVTSIGNFCFQNCANLTSITIPSTVTSIGTNVFSGCSNLASINVEDGNPNYTSIDGVLFNPEKTILLSYPCGKSPYYTVPDHVTTLSAGTFSYCPTLKSLVIPSSVVSFEGGVFSDCSYEGSRFYLGTTEPQCSLGSFLCSPSKVTRFLPIDYVKSSYCELSVDIDSSTKEELKKQENQCYGAFIYGKDTINMSGIFKRPNVAEWEYMTDGCVQFECDNGTGLLVRSICSSTRACQNKQCEEDINGYALAIELKESIAVGDYDEGKLKESIKSLSGVDKDKFEFGVDIDDHGQISRVIIYIADEITGHDIETALEKCTKNNCIEPVLSQAREVKLLSSNQIVEATADTMDVMIMMLAVMMVIMLM